MCAAAMYCKCTSPLYLRTSSNMALVPASLVVVQVQVYAVEIQQIISCRECILDYTCDTYLRHHLFQSASDLIALRE